MLKSKDLVLAMISPFLLLYLACPIQAQSTLKWQGYTWFIRSAHAEGPGPNDWSTSNVWLDSKGFLHMKIAQVNGKWSCAEIWTDHPLGFGTYQCQVEGPIDTIDPNVVFSMFSYAGPDGTKEIDIEFARWGNPKFFNGSWTVYPNDNDGKKESNGFEFQLDGSYTTSRYTWTKDGIHYWLLGGHQPINSVTNLIKEWDYRPINATHSITQAPIPIHFNLWLFQGKPPTDGKPVEIIVHNFSKG